MSEFKMPLLGADMAAGILKKWLKKPGDTLQKGDLIADVLTDKGIIEVEVFTSGVLEKILVQENQEVPVGTVLAIIREPGEAAVEPTEPISAQVPAPVVPSKRVAISPSARQARIGIGR